MDEDFTKTHLVEHFHYMGWPDHGVPKENETTDFLRLISEAKLVPQTVAEFSKYMTASHCIGPAIVHCSAGIGRTGTLCAVVTMFQEVLARGGFDDSIPLQTLQHLRTQRAGMVQRPEQYVFSILALRDLLLTYAENAAEDES